MFKFGAANCAGKEMAEICPLRPNLAALWRWPPAAFVAMLGAKPGPGKGVWGNLGASGTDLNASATAPLPGAADGARGGPAADAGKAAGAGAAGTKPYVPIGVPALPPPPSWW